MKRRITKAQRPTGTVIKLHRVSTQEQGSSTLGLQAQGKAMDFAITQRKLTVVASYTDIASGKSAHNRPGLQQALTDLREGRAEILMASKLDRLSRSLIDLAQLISVSQQEGWKLVCLDTPELDPESVSSEFFLHVAGAYAQLERRLIGQRTKDALAIRRSMGQKLGRPRSVPDAVVARLVAERSQGRTLTAIASDLNRDGVPLAHNGKTWYAKTVSGIIDAASRDAEAA